MDKLALVFPGQGSQAVGMGADLYAEPVVRATYDEAGDVLGYDVAQVSFAGPLEALSRTDVTQPALLTNSVGRAQARAASRPALRRRPRPQPGRVLGAGGRRSGLVRRRAGAGAAARRSHAAPRPQRAPGGMAAVIGLPDAAVEKLCAAVGDLWPANYNSPGQVVVSGAVAALEKLRRAGAASRRPQGDPAAR